MEPEDKRCYVRAFQTEGEETSWCFCLVTWSKDINMDSFDITLFHALSMTTFVTHGFKGPQQWIKPDMWLPLAERALASNAPPAEAKFNFDVNTGRLSVEWPGSVLRLAAAVRQVVPLARAGGREGAAALQDMLRGVWESCSQLLAERLLLAEELRRQRGELTRTRHELQACSEKHREREDETYIKFSLVLNAKKEKLIELRDENERLRKELEKLKAELDVDQDQDTGSGREEEEAEESEHDHEAATPQVMHPPPLPQPPQLPQPPLHPHAVQLPAAAAAAEQGRLPVPEAPTRVVSAGPGPGHGEGADGTTAMPMDLAAADGAGTEERPTWGARLAGGAPAAAESVWGGPAAVPSAAAPVPHGALGAYQSLQATQPEAMDLDALMLAETQPAERPLGGWGLPPPPGLAAPREASPSAGPRGAAAPPLAAHPAAPPAAAAAALHAPGLPGSVQPQGGAAAAGGAASGPVQPAAAASGRSPLPGLHAGLEDGDGDSEEEEARLGLGRRGRGR